MFESTSQHQPVDAPSADEFSRQLIGQLFDDLNGILFDDETSITAARATIFAAAARGAMRGVTLMVLARAALSAHAALLSDNDGALPPAEESEASTLMQALMPDTAPDMRATLDAETRLQAYVSAVEPRRPALSSSLAQAIYRLYDGMRGGDEALGHHSLFELRSMLVHLDAIACALAADSQLPAVRVIRPDRFHDLFIGYLEAVRAGDGAQQPVATLQQNGRIAALVTEAAHPVQVAEQALRENLADDPATAEAALMRIRALIVFLDELRRSPRPVLGASDDQALQLSLITAAAIAPLRSNGRYAFGELAQIAAYNQQLLRAPPARAVRAH